jgi:GT2 family glycosyltransferase
MPDAACLSFVVPVRNDARHLEVCLASIAADTGGMPHAEVIVADNGSTDESAQVAGKAGARVLDLPGLSVAELRNRAAHVASGSLLAFVDADHAIAAGWSASAREALTDPSVVAAGAPYHPPADGTWVQRTYNGFRDHAPAPADVEWLGSGNLVVRRETFMARGGFDTSLRTCEDVDLCRRLRDAGGRIRCEPRMRTVHFGDPATLRALFVGELWRGRDNVRASFRGTPTWRSLPGTLIPLVDLLLVVATVAGLVSASGPGVAVAGAALAAMAALASLRASVVARRLRAGSPASLAQAFTVAMTYDVARALAAVWPHAHAARSRAEAR